MKTIIPLEIVTLKAEMPSYHLVVRAQLNGSPCELLLDTGASQTVFDRALVPELPLDEQPEIQSSSIAEGELSASAGVIRKFKLGKIKYEDWTVVLMDMKHVNSVYRRFGDRQISGLLGSDFLLKHNAVINYEKQKMTLNVGC